MSLENTKAKAKNKYGKGKLYENNGTQTDENGYAIRP